MMLQRFDSMSYYVIDNDRTARPSTSFDTLREEDNDETLTGNKSLDETFQAMTLDESNKSMDAKGPEKTKKKKNHRSLKRTKKRKAAEEAEALVNAHVLWLSYVRGVMFLEFCRHYFDIIP